MLSFYCIKLNAGERYRTIKNSQGINTYMACGKKQLEKWELNKIIFLNSSIRLTEQTNRKKK